MDGSLSGDIDKAERLKVDKLIPRSFQFISIADLKFIHERVDQSLQFTRFNPCHTSGPASA